MPNPGLSFSKETILNLSIPEPNSGCWLWLGNLSTAGYGRFKTSGVHRKAHRASYILFVGSVPDGQIVRHLCHNKCCVNPEHLAPGTEYDNAQDNVRARIPLSKKYLQSRIDLRHLSPVQENEVREKYKGKKKHTRGGITFESLAREYSTTIKVIWRIINND